MALQVASKQWPCRSRNIGRNGYFKASRRAARKPCVASVLAQIVHRRVVLAGSSALGFCGARAVA
jgi:hypothetical protein